MNVDAHSSLAIVRASVGLLLVVHGAARARLGIVDDFGAFLGSQGIPLGFHLAWTITVVEMIGGLLLAAGFFVRPLALWFAVQLVAGMYMVHSRAGWFVVGAGRNGMEFSVLLIACLTAIALSVRTSHNAPRTAHPAPRP